VLISAMLPKADVVQLLSHATGVRLPVGVRAAGHREPRGDGLRHGGGGLDVGGIPEVVVHGETGLLVPYDEADPRGFEAALTSAVSDLLADPGRAAAMGRAGRERAVAEFDWDAIARRTAEVYRSVLR
jgi:starch synthase